jgi:SAM-dependent methyltransferase
MAVIHDYVVALARRLVDGESPLLLDYGCGAGEIVQRAMDAGIQAYGVDLFYEGGSYRNQAGASGLFGTRILELGDGVIPFADSHFDVIVSNQVFEHIDDFSKPLGEIHRVLKPGGFFVNLFPTAEVWREGHIGIPFVHRFPKGSGLRFAYTLALRTLGAGTFKDSRSRAEWSRQSLAWIDRWTFYKPISDVRSSFERYFTITDSSADYLLYRVTHHPRLGRLAPLFRPRAVAPLLSFLCHRLSGRVFVMRKT